MALVPVTMKEYLNAKKWYFAEKGLQRIWDELKFIANSSPAAAHSTSLEGLYINRTSGGITTTSGEETGRSGYFGNGTTTPVLPPDPGGNYGPVPPRSANKIPTNGFRTNSE